MNKVEALDNIKQKWNDNSISLKEKILSISTDYYSSGLDLLHTASYIKATPSELESLLSLSELDDNLIDLISEINPPKTTWTLFANANSDEIENAVNSISNNKVIPELYSEFVYKSMREVSGPSIESKIEKLTASDIKNIRIKGENYQKLTNGESSLLKTVARMKAMPDSKSLSQKQMDWLVSILIKLVDNNVFTKNSIDNDQELCDKVLNTIGR